MTSVVENRTVRLPSYWSWLVLVGAPMAVVAVAGDWPSWLFMWLLAFAIYGCLKWLSLATFVASNDSPWQRQFGFLFFWPGMDAKSFLNSTRVNSPLVREWIHASGKLILGTFLIAVSASVVQRYPLLGSWLGLIGVVFLLHFGFFHLLSCGWRTAGFDARHIMNAPILASSLADFWGNRWNLAFRDLAHSFVFRPLHRRFGIAGATMSVFLVSGIVHDLVMSIPARGGWGLPTLYFLLQGAAVLLERSAIGRRWGAARGLTGRLFCATVVLGPVFLLFHRPFIERVAVPMFFMLGRV